MIRLLVKYSKKDEASLLSHRETMRCMERALRRSELPLAFTSGYNPRLRMSFSPALPLGLAADGEYLEVAVQEEVNVEEARRGINEALPAGMRVGEIHVLAPTMPRLSRWARYGLYRVSDDRGDVYLLLSMVGDKQGRIRDAMEKVASLRGKPARDSEVTRLGLYASRDEVFEDVREAIFYYDGETGDLKEIEDEES